MDTFGAFAIIQDHESRVLLCHRTDMDAWNLPGGRVEPLETQREAVVREVREEVGLIVRADRLIGLYSVPEQDTLASIFCCVQTGGDIALSDEADDIRWFAREELPSSTLSRHVERIADAYKEGSQFAMRIQVQKIAAADRPKRYRSLGLLRASRFGGN